MAFVVEDGTGLSNATSYVSVADADTFHSDSGNPAAWSGATTGAKQSALQLATQYLDAMYGARWVGERIVETMALDWPRYNAIDRDGWTKSSSAVPKEVKNATAYLALKVINGDTLLPDTAAGANVTSESVGVGPLSTSKSYSGEKTPGKAYRMVPLMLADLIAGSGMVYRS